MMVMAPLACCCFGPTILWSSIIFVVVGYISVWILILRHPTFSLYFPPISVFCLFFSLIVSEPLDVNKIFPLYRTTSVGNHIQVMPVDIVDLIGIVEFLFDLSIETILKFKITLPNLRFITMRTGLLNCLNARSRGLTFRHRASCI